ncbi:MAG: hypothetical protein K1X55_13250 [Chitinophagales bacterium]|nr:hypothetical protein [Chitinophagales bacterium]
MEELLRYEKEIEQQIKQETERLLALGYSQEHINSLSEALECFSYPLIAAYYKHPSLFDEKS